MTSSQRGEKFWELASNNFGYIDVRRIQYVADLNMDYPILVIHSSLDDVKVFRSKGI